MSGGSGCHTPRSSTDAGFDRTLSSISDDTGYNADVMGLPATTGAWEEDSAFCACCSAALGMMRRHHCRLCGASVCGPCSPSMVQVEGQRRPQRACTPCVAGIQAVPLVRRRLVQLSGHLNQIAGCPYGTAEDAGSLMEAVALCEATFLPLDNAIASAQGHAQRAQAEAASVREARRDLEMEAVFVKETLLKLNARLQTLGTSLGGSAPGSPKAAATPIFSRSPNPCEDAHSLQPGSLKAAAADCEAALTQLEAKRGREPWSIRRGRVSTNVSLLSSRLESSMGASSGDLEPGGGCAARTCTWQGNTSNCQICNVQLGKRFLKRRHHCRVCGRCVCSGCSPSNMQLIEGQKQVQRVCTPCAANAQQGTTLTRQIEVLARRLQAISGTDVLQAEAPRNMEQALALCEAALLPVEEMCCWSKVEAA